MNGRMVVAVEIDDVSVPMALISAGFLGADAGEDREAIGRAIGRLIEALVVTDASVHDPEPRCKFSRQNNFTAGEISHDTQRAA